MSDSNEKGWNNSLGVLDQHHEYRQATKPIQLRHEAGQLILRAQIWRPE
jgi:hypothetical protein